MNPRDALIEAGDTLLSVLIASAPQIDRDDAAQASAAAERWRVAREAAMRAPEVVAGSLLARLLDASGALADRAEEAACSEGLYEMGIAAAIAQADSRQEQHAIARADVIVQRLTDAVALVRSASSALLSTAAAETAPAPPLTESEAGRVIAESSDSYAPISGSDFLAGMRSAAPDAFAHVTEPIDGPIVAPDAGSEVVTSDVRAAISEAKAALEALIDDDHGLYATGLACNSTDLSDDERSLACKEEEGLHDRARAAAKALGDILDAPPPDGELSFPQPVVGPMQRPARVLEPRVAEPVQIDDAPPPTPVTHGAKSSAVEQLADAARTAMSAIVTLYGAIKHCACFDSLKAPADEAWYCAADVRGALSRLADKPPVTHAAASAETSVCSHCGRVSMPCSRARCSLPKPPPHSECCGAAFVADKPPSTRPSIAPGDAERARMADEKADAKQAAPTPPEPRALETTHVPSFEAGRKQGDAEGYQRGRAYSADAIERALSVLTTTDKRRVRAELLKHCAAARAKGGG